MFTYIALGELVAFVVGWTLLLETVLGSAAVGKAWSQHLDMMLSDVIRNKVANVTGRIAVPGLETHPDFVAFGIIWIVSFAVLAGTKVSL